MFLHLTDQMSAPAACDITSAQLGLPQREDYTKGYTQNIIDKSK